VHTVNAPNRVFKAGAVLLLALAPSNCLHAEEGGLSTPMDSLEYWLGPEPDGLPEANSWRAHVGTEYSHYTLGPGEDAAAWMQFYALSLTRGSWTAGVNGSYQRFTAPVPDLGLPSALPAQHTISGSGDTSVSLRYDIDARYTGMWFTSVSTRIKLPTASEAEGLGTGKVDATLAVDAIRPLGAWAVFASAGHTWRGGSSRFSENTIWNASAGVDYRLTPRWNVGASYDWRQLGIGGQTAGVYSYARYRITDSLSVTGYSIAGLDRNSPDYSIGVQFGLLGLW